MEIFLLVGTIIMFGLSMIMLGRAKYVHSQNKNEIQELKKSIEENTELCNQLYKLHTSLNESHKLSLKAFDILLKSQKLTVSDLNEFKEHVANAMVAIVEEFSAGSTNKNTSIQLNKIKDGKLN